MVKTSNWDGFWKDKFEKFEWTQKDAIKDSFLDEYIKGKELLELGSGMGLCSLHFGHRGMNVTLLDKSPEVKLRAKKFWGDLAKHKFICEDLFDYNPKKKFDAVISFGLCEHFIGEQRRSVLKKHIDLLKTDGTSIISVPHKYGIFYRISKFLQEKTGFWYFGLEVPFSKKELITFAKNNNLNYKIFMSGFYSSMYDLFIRKPLKVVKIHTKRRFDGTRSVFDNFFGSGLLIILRKIK